MRSRTASAECASPPSDDAIDEVKKYFSSKMPRLVAMYLLAVTRDTVDSCMLMASATVLRLSGRRCCTPCTKKRVLLFDDLDRDLEDGLGALIERAHQPGRGLQILRQIGLGAVGLGVLRELGVIALVDQHLRQGVGVELDDEAAVRAGAHIDVGHDRLHHASKPKARPGFGLRLRISAIMSARSSSPTPQMRRKRGKIALGQQIEAADQRLPSRDRSGCAP